MFHKFSSFSYSEINASLKLIFSLEAMFMKFSLFFYFLLISDLVFYIDFYMALSFLVWHFLISIDFNRKSYKINQTIRTSSNHMIFSTANGRTKKLIDFRFYTVGLILYNKSHTINLMQFARIHTSSLINIEKTLNRAIIELYNGDCDCGRVAAN